MVKLYLFGFGIIFLSLLFVFANWKFFSAITNPYLVMLILIVYLAVFFGSLISLLKIHLPDSKITRRIKKAYEWIIGGL